MQKVSVEHEIEVRSPFAGDEKTIPEVGDHNTPAYVRSSQEKLPSGRRLLWPTATQSSTWHTRPPSEAVRLSGARVRRREA
jgi:hypothetical protein